jgi:ribonuclease Y
MRFEDVLRMVLELVVVGLLAGGAAAFFVRRSAGINRIEKEQHQEQLRLKMAELEQQKKQAVLEAREEVLKLKEATEAELKDQRAQMDRLAESLQRKEDFLQERQSKLETRESEINRREADLQVSFDLALQRQFEADAKLEAIAKLTKSQAKERVLQQAADESRAETLERIAEIEANLTHDVENKAKRMILEVMERNSAEYVTEATVAVVSLPSDEMKGRLIGREGRNIRAFEQVTGVDLIIDETPEAVVVSSFDPIRRETARLALMNLMIDGRIHPGRIEELYEKAQIEVERTVKEAGQRAADQAGVLGLPSKVTETMGRLRFRTSYAQNVLDHSVEVAVLGSMFAAEMGLNVEITRKACFLHDIGKALPSEWEGPHALTGMEFLKQQGIKEPILNAVGAHHREIEPTSNEAQIVIIADGMSASRPGARRESLDNYVKRLENLEELASGFPGVDRAYALHAGREVRVLVRANEVDDLGSIKLAKDIAKRIEQELSYPGQIKVTVIREMRSQETAR